MSKGIYPRDEEWKEKQRRSRALSHSIVVTGTPRTGILQPYIGRVFCSQRELALVLGVTPRAVNYWLSIGYINLIKNLKKIDE